MSDQGGSCTLIFYKIGNEFWREPFLNLVAAAFQMSSFTHVEIAIGARPFPRALANVRVTARYGSVVHRR